MFVLKSTYNKLLMDLEAELSLNRINKQRFINAVEELGEAQHSLNRVVKHNKKLLNELLKAKKKIREIKEIL